MRERTGGLGAQVFETIEFGRFRQGISLQWAGIALPPLKQLKQCGRLISGVGQIKITAFDCPLFSSFFLHRSPAFVSINSEGGVCLAGLFY